VTKTFTSIALLVLAIYLVLGIILYIKQRSFVFIPPPETQDSQLDSFRFASEDAVLKIWRLNTGNDNAIIYFGGNAEDPWYNHEAFEAIFPNHTVYLVNYRGYGGSTGAPSETGLYSDALQIFDSLQNTHDEISIIGRSLGSALATRVAATRDVARVALITPFDSLEQIAKGQYPFYPIKLMLKDKFPSIKNTANIKAPTLIIMAEDDNVVPKKNTERLIAEFGPIQLEIETIKAVNHNTIARDLRYTDLLRSFFTL